MHSFKCYLLSKNAFVLTHRLSCNNTKYKLLTKIASVSYSQDSPGSLSKPANEEEFRVLDLKPKKNQFVRRKPWKAEVMPPRSSQMAVDQDWPSVWPGPRTFHPAVVPLPVRQGYTVKGAPPPSKFANAELMKIPNFLHLTPPAIKKQCEALKRFCTAWPKGLDTDEKCQNAFPIEVISSDYCHSSPVIRNPLSRIVTIKVKIGSLPLDTHARDKMLRLVGDRYNSTTDELVIVADRCPLRKQNYDFALYILTALYHESWKVEPWESEKSTADMEFYNWDNGASKTSLCNMINWPNSDTSDPSILQSPNVSEYRQIVSELYNTGEDQYSIDKYKAAAMKVFSMPEHTSRL